MSVIMLCVCAVVCCLPVCAVSSVCLYVRVCVCCVRCVCVCVLWRWRTTLIGESIASAAPTALSTAGSPPASIIGAPAAIAAAASPAEHAQPTAGTAA